MRAQETKVPLVVTAPDEDQVRLPAAVGRDLAREQEERLHWVQKVVLLVVVNVVVALWAFLAATTLLLEPPAPVVDLPAPRLHAADLPDAPSEHDGVDVRRFVGD